MSTSGPRVQQNVNPPAWMVGKESRRRHTSSEMDVDIDEDTSMGAVEPLRLSGNLQDSRWADSKWELPAKRLAPSEAVPTPSATPTATAAPDSLWTATHAPVNAENIHPLATLKDSKWATSSFTPSVQDNWPSYNRSVPAPALSHSHSHYTSPNPLRQTSSHFSVKNTAGPQNVANPFAQVSNYSANTASPDQFSFGATTKSVNQRSTTTAAPANTATNSVPVAQPERRGKTLKDSMWA